jgi:hypothetical protein
LHRGLKLIRQPFPILRWAARPAQFKSYDK